MTLERLLNLPVADIEALTDEQLEVILTPFFPVTRPRGGVGLLESLTSSDDSLRARLEELRKSREANTLQF